MTRGNGAAAVAVETDMDSAQMGTDEDLEEKVDVAKEQEKTQGVLAKAKNYFSRRNSVTSAQKELTPQQTKDRIYAQEEQISAIGAEKYMGLPAYVRGPVLKLLNKWNKAGMGKVKMAEDQFLECCEEAEAVLSGIGDILDNQQVNGENVPIGLRSLRDWYDDQRQNAAESGVEGYETIKELDGRVGELDTLLSETDRSNTAARQELRTQKSEVYQKIRAVKKGMRCDTREFLSYEKLHERAGEEVDILEGVEEKLHTGIEKATVSYYDKSPTGITDVEQQVTTAGIALAEMFDKLGEYLGVSEVVKEKTYAKREALAGMKTSYHVGSKGTEKKADPLVGLGATPDNSTESVMERMRQVANYQR
ncbi:MAG: hypothetical protein ABIG89_02775 [Candidatus Woesearchaeota archaeon]